MGSVTFVVDGMPVTMDDRTYSLDSTVTPVDPNAYKVNGSGESVSELWRTQPALRMVTTFLAENIAQVPLHAFQRLTNGDRERLPGTDVLAQAVSRPDSPRVTYYEMMHTLVLDLCLWDRWAAQVFLNPDGSAQLVRLPPSSWQFERDSTGRPKVITASKTGGGTFPIALDRAVWMDGYPSDKNTSPIDSLRGILAEYDAAREYRAQLWQNAGRFPGWISRPVDAPLWTKTGRDRFRDGWDGYSATGQRAGKTPLLEEGMEYHPGESGINPENGQQIEGRKLSIAEVANAYHIPPQMVGQDSGSSYNSVTGYREMLYSDALGSKFEQIGQAFNARLVPQLADPTTRFVEFNVAAKLKLAFEEQARIFQTAVGGPVMTRAEARQRLNLPYMDGTDELIVPLNVVEGGQASPTDSGSQNIGGN